MGELYDTDFVLWSEQQADRLRRLAHGEQVNDVDWPNLIEEVDSLGRSATSAVRSLLARALEHMMKAAAWPQAQTEGKWLHDADVFLSDAQQDWTPSMSRSIDLPAIYARALRRIRDLEYAEGPPGWLPEECPVRLAELLQDDVRELARRFAPPSNPHRVDSDD